MSQNLIESLQFYFNSSPATSFWKFCTQYFKDLERLFYSQIKNCIRDPIHLAEKSKSLFVERACIWVLLKLDSQIAKIIRFQEFHWNFFTYTRFYVNTKPLKILSFCRIVPVSFVQTKKMLQSVFFLHQLTHLYYTKALLLWRGMLSI